MRRRANKIVGWWHQMLPGSHQWTPEAWAKACDLSLARSRERRGCS